MFRGNSVFRHAEINDVVVSLRDTWYKRMSSAPRGKEFDRSLGQVCFAAEFAVCKLKRQRAGTRKWPLNPMDSLLFLRSSSRTRGIHVSRRPTLSYHSSSYRSHHYVWLPGRMSSHLRNVLPIDFPLRKIRDCIEDPRRTRGATGITKTR